MKAIIEGNDGLYIIRIKGNDGALCDVYVVDEVELKGQHCSLSWQGGESCSEIASDDSVRITVSAREVPE